MPLSHKLYKFNYLKLVHWLISLSQPRNNTILGNSVEHRKNLIKRLAKRSQKMARSFKNLLWRPLFIIGNA